MAMFNNQRVSMGDLRSEWQCPGAAAAAPHSSTAGAQLSTPGLGGSDARYG